MSSQSPSAHPLGFYISGKGSAHFSYFVDHQSQEEKPKRCYRVPASHLNLVKKYFRVGMRLLSLVGAVKQKAEKMSRQSPSTHPLGF
jgi:hypothetical protein